MAVTSEQLLNKILDEGVFDNERLTAIKMLKKNTGLDRDGLVHKLLTPKAVRSNNKKTKAMLEEEIQELQLEVIRLSSTPNKAVNITSTKEYVIMGMALFIAWVITATYAEKYLLIIVSLFILWALPVFKEIYLGRKAR